MELPRNSQSGWAAEKHLVPGQQAKLQAPLPAHPPAPARSGMLAVPSPEPSGTCLLASYRHSELVSCLCPARRVQAPEPAASAHPESSAAAWRSSQPVDSSGSAPSRLRSKSLSLKSPCKRYSLPARLPAQLCFVSRWSLVLDARTAHPVAVSPADRPLSHLLRSKFVV
jgi:hypothetical protein